MYSKISQVINKRADQIDGLLSEYRAGLRTQTPQKYFMDMRLHQHDHSLGNIVTVKINFSGTLYQFEEHVLGQTPSIPLRIFVEFDTQIDAVVAIVIEATSASDKTRVTISTIDAYSPYLSHFMEDLFAPHNLAYTFNAEYRKFTLEVQKLVGVAQAS